MEGKFLTKTAVAMTVVFYFLFLKQLPRWNRITGSGLDRKEPLPGILRDGLPVMPEKRPAVRTDELLITNQRTGLDFARLQGADSKTASLLTL